MFDHRSLLRLAVAAGLFIAIAGCSSKAGRIDSGLKKGAEFVKAAAWDKASVEVRNVLQIDPKNAQAMLLSARVAEGQGNVNGAYGGYLKAVELQPDLRDAQVGLARLYVFADEQVKADALIRSVLAADPGNAQARSLAASLTLRRGNVEGAMAEAKAIIDGQKAAPVDASMLLAGIYASQGKRAEALAAIDRALQSEPINPSLLQVAAQITSSAPKADAVSSRAAEYFKRAAQATPKNVDVWRAWSAYHARRGEADKAETVLREAASTLPQDVQRQIDLANFVASARGLVDAEAVYQAAIKAAPREMSLRFGLVQTLSNFNRTAGAQGVLAEIVDLNQSPDSVNAAKGQLAAYRLQAGQLGDARRLVAEVLAASPRDNAALALRGRIHLLDNKPRDAIIDLRTALRDQPESAQITRMLAQAHRAAGEPQLARETLAEAVKARPADLDLRLLLVADMVDAKDSKAAIAELDAALKAAPKAARLYEAKAKIQYAQKDSNGAEKTLAELKSQSPKDVAGYVLLGQLHSQQKRFDAALREYDLAADAAPANPLPYASAVGLLIGQKRFDDANVRIERRLKADAGNVIHYQLKGDVAMARRDLAAAEDAYRQCIRVAPTAAVGYVNSARTLAVKGDLEGALGVLKSGEQAAPDETAIPVARAELLARAQRFDEAIEIYDAVYKRFPDNDVVANNLAFLLAEVKSDKASAQRALLLAGRFAESRDPNQLDSLGWIHYRLGQYDQAVPILERAASLAPPTPLLQLHLGKALVKSGNVARGKEQLKKAIDSKANLPRLDEARAMLAQG